MKDILRLMASLCPEIKQRTNQPMGFYKPPIILFFLFLCSVFAAKAQEIEVHSTPVAKAGTVKVPLVVPEGGIVLGDTLPEAFWEQELKLVSHPDNVSVIKLADYRNKLLVLDFWANYCSPCIESIETWERLQPQFANEVEVILVHIFYSPGRAKSMVDQKGWKLPVAAGNENAELINSLFYASKRFGQIWIKDGKLFAIPKHEMANSGMISQVLANGEVDIEMDDYLTYFDKQNTADAKDPVLKDN